METSSFNRLTMSQKAALIQSHGTLLVSLVSNVYMISLFVMDAQYLELYYNAISKTIDDIRIATYENLDKYIEYVTLDL